MPAEERAVCRRLPCSGRRPNCRLYPTLCPMSLDGDCKRVALFGGWEHVVVGVDSQCSPADRAHVLDVETGQWEELVTTGATPPRVAQHVAVPHPLQPGRMLLYGGCDDEGNRVRSLYDLDLQSGKWESADASCGKQGTSSHTAVLHQASSSVYVFGGNDGVQSFSDLWCLSLRDGGWSLVVPEHPPRNLRRHRGDRLRQRLHALYSEPDASGSDSEASCSPKRRPPPSDPPRPPRRLYHCSCMARDSLFVFGGAPDPKTTTAADPVYDDLWRFDLDGRYWTEVTCEGGTRPSARGSASCVFLDPFVYIYGGFDGLQDYRCMHRFDVDIQRWEQISVPVDLPPRWGHACCTLPKGAGAGFVVYGGFSCGSREIYDDAVVVKHTPPPLKYLVAKAVLLSGFAPRRRKPRK
eukprot:TRINITY_DN43655_c0_g1_i1.p1 TRINITY_DN43655_c0_g1~~TRINITY_DN43655_c0_g1_i1.p1  ORF type:complete len:429 (+),score=110.17 TRINITY_DN43655_c0_g1_i1:62-1288(+)